VGQIKLSKPDITPSDLTLPHLRRRAGLLSNFFFRTHAVPHVAGNYFCAFAGAQETTYGRLGHPAIVFLNPQSATRPDEIPFESGLSNTEFAHLLGVEPSLTDPDNQVYGL